MAPSLQRSPFRWPARPRQHACISPDEEPAGSLHGRTPAGPPCRDCHQPCAHREAWLGGGTAHTAARDGAPVAGRAGARNRSRRRLQDEGPRRWDHGLCAPSSEIAPAPEYARCSGNLPGSARGAGLLKLLRPPLPPGNPFQPPSVLPCDYPRQPPLRPARSGQPAAIFSGSFTHLFNMATHIAPSASHLASPELRAREGDLFNIDAALTEDERAVRDSVRRFVNDRVLPIIGDCYVEGRFPKELIPGLAELGVLGANLPEEYGCAGLSNVAYGLIMQELERGDSGIRSFASVQGALVMYPIFAFGSEEQKREWLPRLAAGEKIGCFGLTEPDYGSNPSGMITMAHEQADGSWVLNGAKMWITNGSQADVAIVWAKTNGDQSDKSI